VPAQAQLWPTQRERKKERLSRRHMRHQSRELYVHMTPSTEMLGYWGHASDAHWLWAPFRECIFLAAQSGMTQPAEAAKSKSLAVNLICIWLWTWLISRARRSIGSRGVDWMELPLPQDSQRFQINIDNTNYRILVCRRCSSFTVHCKTVLWDKIQNLLKSATFWWCAIILRVINSF
jgi:hypothetical protein